jgi:hypothetical protein
MIKGVELLIPWHRGSIYVVLGRLSVEEERRDKPLTLSPASGVTPDANGDTFFNCDGSYFETVRSA